jgi:hypothetical protein
VRSTEQKAMCENGDFGFNVASSLIIMISKCASFTSKIMKSDEDTKEQRSEWIEEGKNQIILKHYLTNSSICILLEL